MFCEYTIIFNVRSVTVHKVCNITRITLTHRGGHHTGILYLEIICCHV